MNGKMRVSEEFLIESLYLPDNTRIVGVSVDWMYGNRPIIVFIVNHPDILTDDVSPEYEAIYDTHRNKIIRFVGWK